MDAKSAESWWPAVLKDVRDLDPWADADVVVAEVVSFADGRHTGHRHSFCALVPLAELESVKKGLAKFDYGVHASGPRPWASPEHPYTPKFWIAAEATPSRSYEPLVLSWRSHDKTVLQLDPGFLMTYGLAPENIAHGETRWDDPAAPVYGVAKVSAPSVWNFPSGTHAFVTVRKAYLQDYLSLRQVALVQTFWEIRYGATDREIEEKLGSEEGVEIALSDRRFSLRRSWEDKQTISAQVWAARVLAVPGPLPISNNDLEHNGLLWPGFQDPVADADAMRMSVADLVYVKDVVLGDFEGRPEYRVNPMSGSVTFGTQWSVGFCDRLGRDLISLELKKLYEGAPPDIVREWHRHAVSPPNEVGRQRMARERNVGARAEFIVFAIAALGESLSKLARDLGQRSFLPEDFVGLRREALKYHGWWTLDELEPIARHIASNITGDDFLNRCMSLYKVVGENLSEKNLRLIVHSLGVPAQEVAEFGSFKLLDRIICMAQVAEQSGLNLARHGKALWDRLDRDGTQPAQPIAHLFALYDLRVLAGHMASDRHQRLGGEVKRFGVTLGRQGVEYGLILDRVYDEVASDLQAAQRKIDAALAVSTLPPPSASSKILKEVPVVAQPGQPKKRRRRGRRGGRRNRRGQAGAEKN
jgi:hypothetical protein